MKTITEFVETVSQNFGESLEIKYLHPVLYLVCTDEIFARQDTEERELTLAKKCSLGTEEIEYIKKFGSVQICLVTSEEKETELEFLHQAQPGHHWIEWFSTITAKRSIEKVNNKKIRPATRAVHFYGYKGGQARSTVLLLVAKKLANLGMRVLIVDADLEAPSLDSMLSVTAERPEQTLMGLCGWSYTKEINPISKVYAGTPMDGYIDLLACRPRVPQFDLDFASFTLTSALDARTLEQAMEMLQVFAEGRFDIVLFDHRTGITASVLPIVQSWPGSAVLFVRPDSTTRPHELDNAFQALLAQDSENPGLFVSFSLDPKDSSESAKHNHGRYIEHLLTLLSRFKGGLSETEADPSELERSWVLWPHDRTLLQSISNPDDLSKPTGDALANIIDELELGSARKPLTASPTQPKLTKSGATDEGWFILTPDLARLFSPDSNLLYIFGRKGTGKTRLVKELHLRGLGETLLVASDYQDGGIQSGGTNFTRLMDLSGHDFDNFWWNLVYLGIQNKNPRNQITEAQIDNLKSADKPITSTKIEELCKASQKKRVFLIDGVETAVAASDLRKFIEALFRTLSTIQYNRTISSRVTVRLFLRTDLAKNAIQNIEQQTEGNEIQLKWNKAPIYNFALGRIVCLGWFNANFREICQKISAKQETISRGALPESEAEELLLQIFPRSLERNKLKTTTFFSTYFSDAGGDNDSKASFYPRLFDGFLREINDTADNKTIKDGLLSSQKVLGAYDEASARFINEVTTELYALLKLGSNPDANQGAVDGLIGSFAGKKTPFVLTHLVEEISEETPYGEAAIREALQSMKAMGIFEDRPGYPGSWRTGRVYKSGLKMKYVRTSNTDD